MSEWDIVGKKPISWELAVAEAIYLTEGKNAYLYVLEKLVESSKIYTEGNWRHMSNTDWRVVLDHLDFFERKKP